MSGYGKLIRGVNEPTPQMEKAREDQVENSAGGFVFTLDPWKRLRRFLVLGSESPTYYASAKDLTKENLQTIEALLRENPRRVVDEVVKVSDEALAPKNEPAILVLAKAATTTCAVTTEDVRKVCRIGTHLFQFCLYLSKWKGSTRGRRLRRLVSAWYDRPPKDLAYQIVKYRDREGWTHRDVLRTAHPSGRDRDIERPREKVERRAILDFAVRYGHAEPEAKEGRPAKPARWWESTEHENTEATLLIDAFLEAQKTTDTKRLVTLIQERNLPREALPTEALTRKEVWEALLQKMPMTAMIRNLGNMAKCGLLSDFSDAEKLVCERLIDLELLRKARIHPIAILAAHRTYSSGKGVLGKGEWIVSNRVVQALDDAFTLAFQAIEPAGKRFMLGLDVSGSMTCGTIAGVAGLTPREAVAAMALVTARTEPFCASGAFCDRFSPFPIARGDSLASVLSRMNGMSFGGTDCAIPILQAIESKIPIDTFVVYTDNETWAGKIHPFEALKRFRQASGIDAKLVVVGMTSTGFTIADPNDAGMLDVIGFDASAPSVMSAFARGEV